MARSFVETGGASPSDSENEDELFRVLQEVQGSVNPTAPNTLVVSVGKRIEANGWVTVAQAFVATADVPHGRYYMELSVLQNQRSQFDRKQTAGILWRGYEGPASVPNFYVNEGAYIFLRVWGGTNSLSTDNLSFYCQVSNRPVGGSFMYNETPGSGVGEEIVFILASPSAGADYAIQTVPGTVRWRLRGLTGQLATAIAAASRVPALYKDNGAAANRFQVDAVWTFIPASTTDLISWGIGSMSAGGNANQTVMSVALSDAVLDGGDRFYVLTSNIQGADQWAAGAYTVDEWAVPA